MHTFLGVSPTEHRRTYFQFNVNRSVTQDVLSITKLEMEKIELKKKHKDEWKKGGDAREEEKGRRWEENGQQGRKINENMMRISLYPIKRWGNFSSVVHPASLAPHRN